MNVSSPDASIVVGETQQFTADVYDLHGNPLACPALVSWSSDAAAVATVTSSGLSTAVAPGTTTIRATCGSVSGSASLEVLPAALTWTVQPSGTTRDLYGVSGTSGSDVFISGDWGTILHYDGAVWTPMTSGTGVALHNVRGAAPDDVYAVGALGTILHFDGAAWSSIAGGTTLALTDVWGSADSDVLVTGNGGLILHGTR